MQNTQAGWWHRGHSVTPSKLIHTDRITPLNDDMLISYFLAFTDIHVGKVAFPGITSMARTVVREATSHVGGGGS